MSVALQVDADHAIAIFEERLLSCENPDAVVASICTSLGAGIRSQLPIAARPDYLRPRGLRRLLTVLYRHIRPEEDLVRTGGPYTPTIRDDIQRFRDGLLTRLGQSEDTAASAEIRELLDEPVLARSRDWILHLLSECVARDADRPAWRPVDLREFAQQFETDPRTDRDLFRILTNRFTDIKDDVETSDNSLREELRKGDDEYHLRRWLARKLSERSRNRYTVPQEEEIDQEHRLDLRPQNPRTNPVSIEIKWADNWSLAQLLERLDNQLVGQYMRARNSRYGIYLLATDGRKGHWETSESQLDFNGVVTLVSRRAGELLGRPGIIGLRVVPIDFRPPPRS